MQALAMIVGLMLATVLAVGAGDRLKLPYPVLMVLLTIAVAFIPGFPHIKIDPELILPLFLPPLLYATAIKTSWAVFRIRWRSIVLLAVGLVVLTVVVVAGTSWLLIASIGVPGAIALGAMVAPPDPVAVESVAGGVHMPRRLMTVLQSEGLFNDAAAIVIFQAAVGATVAGSDVDVLVGLRFLVGAAIAVALGLAAGWLTKAITRFVGSSVARSAITLVVPFAIYIAADSAHASGVIAVVVTALEIQRNARPQDAAERITGHAFWNVVELLATGLAFGLVGLEIRNVIAVEGAGLWAMLGPAGIICAVVVVVRALWVALLIPGNRHRGDGLPPTTAKDVAVLTWCGMRGLATLALALALPPTMDNGAPFPGRDQIIVTACAVLMVTLVLPGLTLPWLMHVLKAAESPSAERQAERVLGRRAQDAAASALRDSSLAQELGPERLEAVRKRMLRLGDQLAQDDSGESVNQARRLDARGKLVAAQTIALDAARQEVLLARADPDTDPEVADRVLRRLDLRTVILED